MKQVFEVTDETFGKKIILFTGTYNQAMAFGRKWKPSWNWTDKDDGSSGLTIGYLTQNDWFIWMVPFKKLNNAIIAILSHELLHVSMRIL